VRRGCRREGAPPCGGQPQKKQRSWADVWGPAFLREVLRWRPPLGDIRDERTVLLKKSGERDEPCDRAGSSHLHVHIALCEPGRVFVDVVLGTVSPLSDAYTVRNERMDVAGAGEIGGHERSVHEVAASRVRPDVSSYVPNLNHLSCRDGERIIGDPGVGASAMDRNAERRSHNLRPPLLLPNIVRKITHLIPIPGRRRWQVDIDALRSVEIARRDTKNGLNDHGGLPQPRGRNHKLGEAEICGKLCERQRVLNDT